MDVNTDKPMGRGLRVTESMLQDKEAEQAKASKAAEQINNSTLVRNLQSYIEDSLQAAIRTKTSNHIDERFLSCDRRRKGEYEPDKLASIKETGGSKIWMHLSSMKCRGLESWVRDVILPPGDKPWSLCPTPIPELPQAIEMEIKETLMLEAAEIMYQQDSLDAVTNDQIRERSMELKDDALREKKRKAKKDAKRMEMHINDQLVQGKYYTALSQFITDLATFPTAFIKGPVVRMKKKLVWTEDQQGRMVPAVEEIPTREYQRVSGYDIFPSPGAKNIQDGSLCERARLRLQDLESMLGTPGFKEDAVRAVLREHRTGKLRRWLTIDQERADLEDRPNEHEDPNPLLDCIIFWGSVQGQMLLDWGMPKAKIADPDKSYQITAWMIDQWVVMARLNPHPLGDRPYYAASFESVNDNIWGRAPAELFKDCQDMCNAAARAISNNLGIASGPLVEVFKNRLAPGYDFTQLRPWEIIETEDDGLGANNPAVRFFQPQSVAAELLKVFEFFFQQASEQSGIPAYIYGSTDVGGAGETASGLSMMMNAANKTLKGVIAHIDEAVITPSIKNHWIHVMLYDNDIEKMGDIDVVARASQHLIVEEQLQMRKTEMLQATNNEWDKAIIGDKGRAVMLKDLFDSLKLDSEDIVPDKEEMERREMMAQVKQDVMSEMGVTPEEMANVPGPAVIDAAGNQKGVPPGAAMTPGLAMRQ